jgi:hypothetical protein
MSESCWFSLKVDVDGDTVYRDVLSGIKCTQKIGPWKRKLAKEYKGTITDFYYGEEYEDALAKEEDIPETMSFQKLYDTHGKRDEAAFFVEITKKSINPANLDTMKKIKELEKQRDAISDQIWALQREMKAKEEETKKKGKKTRKQRRV